MTLRRTFADNLRASRIARDMTQAELASSVGLTQQAIARLENGRGTTTLDTVEALARALRKKVVSLLTEKKSAAAA